MATNLIIIIYRTTSLTYKHIYLLYLQGKAKGCKNARLADICLSTSAAPTYLPAHNFKTSDRKGNTRSFDLIDGAVAANNPVSSTTQYIYTGYLYVYTLRTTPITYYLSFVNEDNVGHKPDAERNDKEKALIRRIDERRG